jgi:hypothetical protein
MAGTPFLASEINIGDLANKISIASDGSMTFTDPYVPTIKLKDLSIINERSARISGDAILQDQISDLASITGDYTLLTTTESISGDLQSQIDSNSISINNLASITGNYTLLTTTESISGDLQSQIDSNSISINNLASITGNYTLLTTTESISGDLQSQIDSKQPHITLVAGSNISIVESPIDTWTIGSNGSIAATTNATNTTRYPLFASSISGDVSLYTDGDLTYNPSTNLWTVKAISSPKSVDSSQGFGLDALKNNTGANNTAVGYQGLFTNITGGGNVAIGYQAGYYETGSNKLHIANNSSSSLVYGDFDAGTLAINLASSRQALFSLQGSTYADLNLGGGAGALGQLTLHSDGAPTTADRARIRFTTSSVGDDWAIQRVGAGSPNLGKRISFCYGNLSGAPLEVMGLYQDGGVQIGGTYGTSPGAGNLSINSNSAALPSLTVKGATGQTADLQQWQDSSGNSLVAVHSEGFSVRTRPGGANQRIYIRPIAGNETGEMEIAADSVMSLKAASFYQYYIGGSSYRVDLYNSRFRFKDNLTFGEAAAGLSANVQFEVATQIRSNNAAAIPLYVRGFTGQTANLQEWQNSAGQILAFVASNGAVSLNPLQAAITPLTVNMGSTRTAIFSLNSSTYADLNLGGGAGALGQLTLHSDGLPTTVNQARIRFTTNTGSDSWLIQRVGQGSPNLNKRLAFQYGTIGGTLLEPLGLYQDGGVQVGGTFSTSPGSGNLAINSNSAALPSLTVKGAAAQTANLQEWRNSTNSILTSIASDGNISLIKGVPYSWPSSNSIGTLTNNGSGGLSWQQPSSSFINLDSVPTPTTSGSFGQMGVISGYMYIWTGINTVVRQVVETSW